MCLHVCVCGGGGGGGGGGVNLLTFTFKRRMFWWWFWIIIFTSTQANAFCFQGQAKLFNFVIAFINTDMHTNISEQWNSSINQTFHKKTQKQKCPADSHKKRRSKNNTTTFSMISNTCDFQNRLRSLKPVWPVITVKLDIAHHRHQHVGEKRPKIGKQK